MKKLLTILFFIGCTKREIQIISPATILQDANTVTVIADLNMDSVWDGGGKVLRINDHIIHGSGTLQNWIIDAPLSQQIFDTSINLKNIQTYDGVFSTAWYGTSSANTDNWWNIQKSINVCRDNNLPCFTPGDGIYKYSKTLEISSIINNTYKFCSVHFYGDASYWYNGKGTIFQYTGTTGPAFNMQLNKGSEIDHVVFQGLWKSPGGNDSTYFNTLEANYKDISGYNLADNYIGISIDQYPPFDGVTNSGSSGNYIHEVSLKGFGMGLAMSQNGITRNNDATTFDHIYFVDNLKYGFVNGQAQEKGNTVNHIISWGSIYNVINMGLHGASQAGDYTFDYANIAGRCIEPFNMSISQWFSSTIDHWYVENIRDVGKFSAQMPLTISNSTFELALGISKQRIVITSNSPYVSFNNSNIRYYDGIGGDIWVKGTATFNNCNFYGWKIIYK